MASWLDGGNIDRKAVIDATVGRRLEKTGMYLHIENGRTGHVSPPTSLKPRPEDEAIKDVASWNALKGAPIGCRARLYRDDGAEIPVPDALLPTHDSRADLRVGRRRSS